MKIGCDLDNVVFEWQPFWGTLYNHDFDANLDLDELVEWESYKLTHFANYSDFIEWFGRTNGWRQMPYERGAFGALDTLIADGHRIDFITARNGSAIGPTNEWYKANPWPETRTSLVCGMDEKAAVPCQVYIDDSPRVIRGLVDAGKRVIVYDKPWNQEIDEDDEQIIRAHGWREVQEIIEELSHV